MKLHKGPVVASRAMVVSNHPVATATGAGVLAVGGNAVDAAVAMLFSLSVVEPMMVSPFGAGFFVIRDGRSGAVTTIDNYGTVPAAAPPDLFRPLADSLDYETEDGANSVGYLAIGTPGALLGWAHAVQRHGRMPLDRLLRPAIEQATRGFGASPFLVRFIRESASDMARFPATAEVFLPGGRPPEPGQLIVRADYARTLAQIADQGPDALYRGSLGERIVEDVRRNGGLLTTDDLSGYRVHERPPVHGTYRDHELVSVAPPSSGGTHLVQVLNILEGFPIGRGRLAFGSAEYVHLFSEALRVAFEDRFRHMADPAGAQVPVEMLTSKSYAAECRRRLNLAAAGPDLVAPGSHPLAEEVETTHCTAVDEEGTIVSTTQTVQSAFGSKVTVPGTGMLLNNLMLLMDPTPGRPNSIAGGKRILSSMTPALVLRDGRPFLALGTPGGRRIFGSVAQAVLNVIDHGMSLQAAFEAPRAWTQGAGLEIEDCFDDVHGLRAGLERLGHRVELVDRSGGGINGVLVDAEGRLHGAACWRADGVPMGLGGGPAAQP